MSILEQPALDEAKLHEFLMKMVSDLGAAANAALVITGDRLGLYRALAEHGPATPQELARRTGTSERYLREWLATQAASGYVEYSPADGTFRMTPEQRMALADEESPELVVSLATQRAVVYYVRDPGRGFRPESMTHAAIGRPGDDPLAHIAERIERGLRPGGFGLLIVRQIVDEVLFSEAGNEVVLIKHLV